MVVQIENSSKPPPPLVLTSSSSGSVVDGWLLGCVARLFALLNCPVSQALFEQSASLVHGADSVNIRYWILNDESGLLILWGLLLITVLSLITIVMISLLCASAATAASKVESGNSDIYSNGYEKVKKGLCRRLKLHALSSCVSKKRKSKCRSEVAGAKTTSGYGYRTTSPLQVAIVDNSVAPFFVVPENSITRDSDISHIAPLGSNKKGGSKLSPAKFVGRGATVAPGSLLHCGRSGNASSEHLYSDALYNEIADHDTELDEGTVATEKRNHEDVVSTKHSGGQSVTINPTATMRHLQAHVYDTPDFEKKFSTTNSRDGYSQLALYRLEGTQYGDDDLFAYWDAGDPVSHSVPHGSRAALRTYNENSYRFYTSPYTVRTNPPGSDDYYESGGDGEYSKQPNMAANHVYSGIDREARGAFARMRTLSSPNVDSRKALFGGENSTAAKLTRRPSTSSDQSCAVASTERPCSSNAMPRNSQLVYEDMLLPVEAQLNYCQPPLPRFPKQAPSSSDAKTCQQMSPLNVTSYPNQNSPSTSQCQGSAAGSSTRNDNSRESVTLSVERVNSTMAEAPEASADGGGGAGTGRVAEPAADASDLSNHYEYAEPGDAAAWYYHNRSSNDENENERRGLRPSETESLYTEGSAFRYHVITMRPRLGSDGGQNLARQQDYQGRFGPYSCVHLYINEEAIRAQEDNHAYNAVVSFHPRSQQNMRSGNPIATNVYDMPPFEAPRSMPQLHLATTVPVTNAPSTKSPTPNDAFCHFCYLKSFPGQSNGQCVSSSMLGNRVCVCTYNNNDITNNNNKAQGSNNCPSPSSTEKSSKTKNNVAGGNTLVKFFSHFRKNSKNSRQNEQQKKSPRVSSSLLLSADCIRHSRNSHVSISGPTNTERFSHALSPDSAAVCNGGSHMQFLSSPPITPPRFANSWVGPAGNGTGMVKASSPEHNAASRNNRWSQNEQQCRSDEFRSRTVNNIEHDVLDSDHYYSEVQYYQNAYDDSTLTRHVYLPSTLPPIVAQTGNHPINYQATSHQRPPNPSIHRRIYSEPSNSNAFYNQSTDLRSSTADLSPVSTLDRTYEHPKLGATADNDRLQSTDSVASSMDKISDDHCNVSNVPFLHAKSKGTEGGSPRTNSNLCMAHSPSCETRSESAKQLEGSLQNHIYQEIPEAGLAIDGAAANSRDCSTIDLNPYSQSFTPDNTTFEGRATLMGGCGSSTTTGGDIFLAAVPSRNEDKTITSSNDYDTLENTDSELL